MQRLMTVYDFVSIFTLPHIADKYNLPINLESLIDFTLIFLVSYARKSPKSISKAL